MALDIKDTPEHRDVRRLAALTAQGITAVARDAIAIELEAVERTQQATGGERHAEAPLGSPMPSSARATTPRGKISATASPMGWPRRAASRCSPRATTSR